jgi:hypothetical protein
MKFEKSKCYSAVDAEQIAVGSLVYVADNLATLQSVLKDPFAKALTVDKILPATSPKRFKLVGVLNPFALAYLVSSDTNARAYAAWQSGQDIECLDIDTGKWVDADSDDTDFVRSICRPKKTAFRPFKDTNELVSYFAEKIGVRKSDIAMPLIWLRKAGNDSRQLITSFYDYGVEVGGMLYKMQELSGTFTFLDGTPCGVKE